MTLADDLADLPDDALVPVHWIRERLGAAADEDRISDLTVREAADELDRSPSTVRGWCGDGKLEGAYRFRGREWRIPPAALRAFVDAEREPAPREEADLSGWREVADMSRD